MSDAHAFAIQGLSIGWHATSWNATVWMWKRNMFLVSISVLTSFLYISESCAINKGNLCENPPFNFTPLSHFAVFLDLSCRHLHRKVKSPLSKFLPYASSCWTHQFFVVYERWPVAQSWNSFLKKRKSQLHSELTVWHTFFLSHSQVARYGCYVTFLKTHPAPFSFCMRHIRLRWNHPQQQDTQSKSGNGAKSDKVHVEGTTKRQGCNSTQLINFFET